MNDSASNISANTTRDDTEWLPMAAQFTFGILGNFLAIILLLLSSQQHRWDSFYRFYLGLVLSDLSIWLLTSPLSIARYASDFSWDFPPAVCRYDSFVLMFALLSSALIVCAMLIDRLVAMLYQRDGPQQNVSGRIYVFVLITIWILAGLFSSIHLLTHKTKTYFPGSWCYMDYVNLTDDKAGTVNAYLYSIFGLTIVFVTTAVNVSMLVAVVSSTNLRARLMDSNRATGGYDIHSYVFLVTVAVIFASLWTPHLVVILKHAANVRHRQDELELTSIRLVLTNSIINPWLYVVLRKENIERLLECWHRMGNKWRGNGVESLDDFGESDG